MWVYTDWPEQEKAITVHDLYSFADDLDVPSALECGAETASECLFPQHPPVIKDGNLPAGGMREASKRMANNVNHSQLSRDCKGAD